MAHSADELERFKRLNLGDLVRAYGYELDPKESSRSNLVMRHGDGDKVIIATGEDGHAIFYSTKTDRSGSVLDFVMFRENCTLGHARKALRAYTSQPSAAPFPSAHPPPTLPKPAPISRNRAALVAQWHGFLPYAGGYLESRGLTPDTLAAFTDRLRLDERGNVAFRHDDAHGLCGWEKKNWDGFTGYARGGHKGLFAGRAGMTSGELPPRLVVTESAIDALSYYQAHPGPGLYLSFAGSLSPEQETLLGQVLTKYSAAAILAATDNDEGGEAFADFIRTHRPDVLRAKSPVGKDWNDAIRPDTATVLPPLPRQAP